MTLWKASFVVYTPRCRFGQTVREINKPTREAAVKHGRKILKGFYPGCRVRFTGTVVRDRIAEAAAARREGCKAG